jgi:hypothetical protein
MAKPHSVKMLPRTDKRRCTISLSADMDMRLTVYAKRHRLTRSQAASQAIASMVRGIRLGFGDDSTEKEESAA